MKKVCFLLMLVVSFGIMGATQKKETKKTTDDNTVTIYFARHGKTLFNTFDQVQGWADSPLTADGIEVAGYLGEGLKDIKFVAFYSSDAGRQRETLQILMNRIGVKNQKPVELKELREQFYGGFEGGPNSVMANATAIALNITQEEFYKLWKEGGIDMRTSTNILAKADPKGLAEDFDTIKARTQKGLRQIAETTAKNGGGNVLAVSSGSAMQIMISDLTDNPDKNKSLPNAAVVKITYKNGKFTVDEIGNMEYIEKGKKSLKK